MKESKKHASIHKHGHICRYTQRHTDTQTQTQRHRHTHTHTHILKKIIIRIGRHGRELRFLVVRKRCWVSYSALQGDTTREISAW